MIHLNVCLFVWMSLHVHFRWGVTLVGVILYWDLLIPSWDPPFRYKAGADRRQSLEAESMKLSDYGLDSCLCIY